MFFWPLDSWMCLRHVSEKTLTLITQIKGTKPLYLQTKHDCQFQRTFCGIWEKKKKVLLWSWDNNTWLVLFSQNCIFKMNRPMLKTSWRAAVWHSNKQSNFMLRFLLDRCLRATSMSLRPNLRYSYFWNMSSTESHLLPIMDVSNILWRDQHSFNPVTTVTYTWFSGSNHHVSWFYLRNSSQIYIWTDLLQARLEDLWWTIGPLLE